MIVPYDRTSAVEYAHVWAFGRNPAFFDFSDIGGDCTNFASQCIYAGSGVMNFDPSAGWYYLGTDRRSPSWAGVIYLYQFIVNNSGPGPFAADAPMSEVQPGDILQLFNGSVYYHTPVVVSTGNTPHPRNILVAAHTHDADNRPLSTYEYQSVRFIHILGVRVSGKW